uniref:Uncharacterized protein n=1 Tax=Tetranychus urticae TaxID=32264 RepID=T1KQH1_TETUR
MFPNVFFLLLLSLFNVKFSNQTTIESKCNDKYEPARYDLVANDGDLLLTADFQMESTNAFEPILSVELRPYTNSSSSSTIFFQIEDGLIRSTYVFECKHSAHNESTCSSGFFGHTEESNCIINQGTCKWLLKVGTNALITSEKKHEISLIDLIVLPKVAEIVLTNSIDYNIVKDVTGLPIYHWSYARYCEYNKKIYNLDGNMMTLKKENGSFELFIYRLLKSDLENPRHLTLINSKNSSISIFCDDVSNDILVWTKTGFHENSVLDKYILRQQIDRLRCGISLSLEMEGENSSFSFNDAPLKIIHKVNGYDNIIQEVKFESDFFDVHSPEIETTSTASVDQHDVDDENQEHDKVNPLIGIALTIITLVKSYFDLW